MNAVGAVILAFAVIGLAAVVVRLLRERAARRARTETLLDWIRDIADDESSRERRIAAAEDRAEQAAYDVWREAR